ncbi:CBS domain-containing protein [Mesorhizobium sp. SB112]|uniref:CBS domain-containing protein n=1 Tax=Mesorhizobium sp. SB112 TaxID=3151853 RepID=UPI003267C85D
MIRTDFPRLSPAMPIREPVAMFARRGASGTSGRRCVRARRHPYGKDCFRPMLNASYYQQWDGSVADYMSRDVRTLPVDLDFVSAAEEFLARSHRVYPVKRDGEVVGLLHRYDLLEAILSASEFAQQSS